jgi:hypothetical protein
MPYVNTTNITHVLHGWKWESSRAQVKIVREEQRTSECSLGFAQGASTGIQRCTIILSILEDTCLITKRVLHADIEV